MASIEVKLIASLSPVRYANPNLKNDFEYSNLMNITIQYSDQSSFPNKHAYFLLQNNLS